MSYSLNRLPNKEYDFPPPPPWLVWVERPKWDGKSYVYEGHGEVRHLESLQKAKKKVSPYNKSTFWQDWAIYHWDGTKYVLQFEGKRNQPKEQNPLFQIRVKRDDKGRETVVDDHEVASAIESILKCA